MKHNRWIALLLALAMTLSLCSGPALALELGDESEAAASTAVEPTEALPAEQEEEEDFFELCPEDEDDPTEEDGEEEEEDSFELCPEDEDDPTEEDGEEEEAPEAEGSEEQEASGYFVNPLFRDLVSPEQLEEELAREEEAGLEDQASAKVYTKLKDAGKAMRKQMKKRKKVVEVSFKTKNRYYRTVADKLLTEAFKHTGTATEGDYLYGQWDHMTYKTKYKSSKGKYTYTFRYKIHFFTTAAQEKKVDAQVKKLLNSLDMNGDSPFIKVHKIYNYMCDNITYDYAGLTNNSALCHSAYAALVKKKAVCQGYAMLLYRLLTEVGVPCRYVTGTGYDATGSGGPHGWNIVGLDGRYYNVDATWDAENRQSGEYFENFLLSDASFGRHHVRDREYQTADFHKAHPMAAADGDYHVWEDHVTVDREPSCTQDGSQSVHCMDCGARSQVTVIPALDHDWQVYDVWYGESSFGLRYSCTRCGGVTRWYYYSYAQAAGSKGRTKLLTGALTALKPNKTRVCCVKAMGKKRLRVKWKQVPEATGYEVQYARDKRFRKGAKLRSVNSACSLTLKGLKKGKTYYVRVRSLAGSAHSGWSGAKRVKVK